MSKKIKWACPKCGQSQNDKHGKGGASKCQYDMRSDTCYGFICECDDAGPSGSATHGGSNADPCQNANCYHCGWGGTFPVPLFDVKKLKGWAKTAHAAGWTPPPGWTP